MVLTFGAKIFGDFSNLLGKFLPTFLKKIFHEIYEGISSNAKIEKTNTIVTLKRDLSNPRLVVYNSPEAPNPAPRDAPRCCNKISKILIVADIRVIVSIADPICILSTII